jgi:hypothetical protein
MTIGDGGNSISIIIIYVDTTQPLLPRAGIRHWLVLQSIIVPQSQDIDIVLVREAIAMASMNLPLRAASSKTTNTTGTGSGVETS